MSIIRNGRTINKVVRNGRTVKEVRRNNRVVPLGADQQAAAGSGLFDQMYQGAYIDKYWSQTIHGNPVTTAWDTSPFCLQVADPTTQSLYESLQGKAANCIHWGWATAGQYPNFSTASSTIFGWVRSRGCFTSAALYTYDTGAVSKLGATSTAAGAIADILSTPGSTGYNRAETALKNYFTGILNIGHPILLCPWWEMNGTWYAWGRNGTTDTQHGVSPTLGTTEATRAANYKIMWQRAHTWCVEVTAALGKNTYHRTGCITWCWVPNDCRPGGQPDPTPWFPGTDYVDWMGFDAYQYSGAYEGPSQIMDSVYNVCQTLAPDLPININELGCVEEITLPGTKAQYFSDLRQWLKDHPAVCCIDYYQWPASSGRDATIHWDSTTAARTSWQNLISDPRVLANVVNDTTFPLDRPIPDPRTLAL
jgi:hypothetical protein